MMSVESPRAICVAPNGARLQKDQLPSLPVSPLEIARTARACAEAGAAIIHLHVRDKDGGHLLDAEAYGAAIAAIRKECGTQMVIQVSTEAVGIYPPASQRALIRDLRPEAASFALREIATKQSDAEEFARLLVFMRQESILPQIILYSAEDARHLETLVTRGLIPFERLPVLFVLGRYDKDDVSQPSDLIEFLEFARRRPWMVCAFGRREAQCTVAAALLGADMRVGFENNQYLPDGAPAPDNAALVDAVARSLRTLGISLADADQIRSDWSV